MSGSSGGGTIGDFAGNLILAIGIILIIVLIIGIWLFIKAVNTIIRAFVKNPTSKALWLAFLVFCLSLGFLTYVSYTQVNQVYYQAAAAASGFSFISLVITARCVEINQNETFERERGPLVQEILHRPWWHMVDKPEEQEQEAALAA